MSTELPKKIIPVWLLFLFLFLLSLIIGMGIFIGFQQGFFQKNENAVTRVSSPTPESTTEVVGSVKVGLDWLTYTDEKTGFTLKYPPTISLNEDTKSASPSMFLTINVELIDEIPESLPLGMDRETAILDKENLLKGQAQTIGDFAASDALVRIGDMYNGRMTSVLSRFEICSVIFSRKLVFYPGAYRVSITVSGDEESIMTSMPDYFLLDSTNCGGQKMWNRDKMGEFMPTLAKGKGMGEAQRWYDTFSAIIQTITIPKIPPTVMTSTKSPMPTLMCEVSDNAFCNVLSDIKNSMATKNYAGVIAYQNTMSTTCDPEGMVVAVCEGVPKGVVKEGYAVGYNQSEGSIQPRDVHLASIASYISQNGPFIYKGSLQSGDKGVIVYLNTDATELFVLRMKRMGSTWRFDSILIGGTFGDPNFSTLSPTLLE